MTTPAINSASEPILIDPEASRRLLLLAELQAALSGHGIRSVLARNHRLVLRWSTAGQHPYRPSGLTDPQLHVFTPAGTTVATTDGTAYHLTSGHHCPAADPAAAAALIGRRAAAPAQPATEQRPLSR